MSTVIGTRRELLDNAESQARARGFHRFPIVDVDAHHYEFESWADIAQYVDKPSLRLTIQDFHTLDQIIPGSVGDRRMGGRLRRDREADFAQGDDDAPPLVRKFRHTARKMGIDASIVFPTAMLVLGLHPQVEMEVAIARAYARWMTERVLPVEPAIKSMLYLPFNDPDASLQLIEEFGEKPGVVGFMVTSVRYQPVHHNRFMPIYGALQERGLPLAFHPLLNWNERAFEQLNRFLTVHALGFPFYNMIQLSNVVINGLPERFPRLKFVFMEAGLSYLPFLMHRLDSEYMMRPSEAPLLKRKPSEYMNDFYYTTQPLEYPHKPEHLRLLFETIGNPGRLLYSSDYPHWDFNLPSRIYDLPFLSEEDKRGILGGNAIELFRLTDVHKATG